jgi:hypothetical protein
VNIPWSTSLLVLSTLAHYLAIYPLFYLKDKYNYKSVIIISVNLSVLYHLSGESVYFLVPDYCFAGIWFVYDLFLSIQNTNNFYLILFLNLFIFYLNLSVNELNYEIDHSVWHLLSAAKCVWVSRMIAMESN